jgi:DNA repair protein RadC
MKTIKELPPDQRPREQLLAHGAQHLSDQDLLAVLVGQGTTKNDVRAIARKLVKIVDEKGLDLTAKDIMVIDGIGKAKAALIAAAFEFARRRIKPEGLKIKFPADVLPLIQHYGDRKQEHFLCVSINAANEVMSVRVVTMGLIDKSHVHPREVFADVISERASAVVIAHNHPVGDLHPSTEDIEVTARLKEAGKVLGINLLDHIIFNHKDYYSFLENDHL